MTGMVRSRWLACTLGAAAIAVLLPACVPGDAAPPDRGVVVAGPPPDPPAERPPPAAMADALWVPGYWHWIGDRYAWVPGHWERPPRGAHGWRPPHYSFRDGVYRYEAGGWVGR